MGHRDKEMANSMGKLADDTVLVFNPARAYMSLTDMTQQCRRKEENGGMATNVAARSPGMQRSSSGCG